MDWFLYDNGPRHERVKRVDFCFLQQIYHFVFSRLKKNEVLRMLKSQEPLEKWLRT